MMPEPREGATFGTKLFSDICSARQASIETSWHCLKFQKSLLVNRSSGHRAARLLFWLKWNIRKHQRKKVDGASTVRVWRVDPLGQTLTLTYFDFFWILKTMKLWKSFQYLITWVQQQVVWDCGVPLGRLRKQRYWHSVNLSGHL